MAKDFNWQSKARFCIGVSALYVLSVLVIVYSTGIGGNSDNIRLTNEVQQPESAKAIVISGMPDRIVIPNDGIDLPLIQGYYDNSSGTWTLSGYYAQFAMFSTLANNYSGDTFIYGHNNDFVFGALRHHTPDPGSLAYIYTTNGHIFSYSFQSVVSVAPDDMSILDYSGRPSILTIQTCTGSINEWRTMYKFVFNGIVQ